MRQLPLYKLLSEHHHESAVRKRIC